MTRIITYFGILFLLFLQYLLWFSNSGVINAWRLQNNIQQVIASNQNIYERNKSLLKEIYAWKNNHQMLEAHARYDLGMIKAGETFYRFIDDKPALTFHDKN